MSEYRDTLEVVERLGRVVGPLGIVTMASLGILGIIYARADLAALDEHVKFWLRIATWCGGAWFAVWYATEIWIRPRLELAKRQLDKIEEHIKLERANAARLDELERRQAPVLLGPDGRPSGG